MLSVYPVEANVTYNPLQDSVEKYYDVLNTLCMVTLLSSFLLCQFWNSNMIDVVLQVLYGILCKVGWVMPQEKVEMKLIWNYGQVQVSSYCYLASSLFTH